MADIYLKDYSVAKDYSCPEQVDKKVVQEKCKQLQEKIDKGNYEIININGGSEYEKKSSLKVFKKNRWYNNEYEYKAQQYVGVLIYGEDRFIIGSRFDENNEPHFLRYMIENALADYGEVLDDTIHETDDIWNYLLLVMYLERLKKALRKGTFRKYRQFQYNDSRVKGQIDIARYIRLNPLSNGKIAYNAREYTAKNYYNILFLRAFEMMQKKYPAQVKAIMAKNRDVKSALDNLRAQNEDWSTVKIRSVLKETEHKIVNNVYRDYEELRVLSRLIIRKLGVNAFSGEGNKVTGVLIDMTQLWENFLYETILKDFGAEAQKPFYILNDLRNDLRNGLRKIKPDFYIKEKKLVLDAKYKKGWGKTLTETSGWNENVREDVFQVMAYILALGCDKGGVIFPVKKVDFSGSQKSIITEKLSVYADDCHEKSTQKYFFRIPFIVPNSGDEYGEFKSAIDGQITVTKKLLKMCGV